MGFQGMYSREHKLTSLMSSRGASILHLVRTFMLLSVSAMIPSIPHYTSFFHATSLSFIPPTPIHRPHQRLDNCTHVATHMCAVWSILGILEMPVGFSRNVFDRFCGCLVSSQLFPFYLFLSLRIVLKNCGLTCCLFGFSYFFLHPTTHRRPSHSTIPSLNRLTPSHARDSPALGNYLRTRPQTYSLIHANPNFRSLQFTIPIMAYPVGGGRQ